MHHHPDTSDTHGANQPSQTGQASGPLPAVLYTPAQAADVLTVRESWLRRRAAGRLIPCTFLGKHLRFSAADITAIAEQGHRPVPGRTGRSTTSRRW